MGSSSSDRINISARIQKLEVDNRFPLRFYFRMADVILRQADVHREEKDTLYLYITLLRFASLVCETIPDHRDYITCGQRERSSWRKVKKKLLNSLDELEELNPEVKQKIRELNRRNGYQNSEHIYENGESPPHRSDKKKVESVGTCSSSTGGENLSRHQTRKFPSGCRNKRLKKETRIKILLEEAHDWKLPTPCRPMPQAPPAIYQATAPPVEEDMDLVKAIDVSIQSALQERPPFSGPLQIHETNASSSSSTSMDSGDLSQHDSPGGNSHSDSEIHVISIIRTSTTSDSIRSSPTPSAPPVSDDFVDVFFECQSIESTPVEKTESSSSCVICTSTTSDSIRSSPTPSAPPVSDDCVDVYFECQSIELTPIDKGESSSCVICMDAAVEAAFIPCGHMVGCMACLNDIKDKNWDCSVCRAKVDQVLRIYAV